MKTFAPPIRLKGFTHFDMFIVVQCSRFQVKEVQVSCRHADTLYIVYSCVRAIQLSLSHSVGNTVHTPHPLMLSLLTEGQIGWVEFVKHLVNTQRLNPTGE